MRNQKVLVFVDWYLPGYKGGGITTSCAALIQRLDGYFDFSIVTRDHDYRSNAPYPNIESNKWVQLTEHTRIKYLSHSRLKPIEIYRQIKSDEYDSVYVNSFFSFYFSILPLLLVKLGFIKTRVIIAPMGMLNPVALGFKWFKKALFISISKLGGLYKNICWHAASAGEERDIKQLFPKAKIIVASYVSNSKHVEYVQKIKQPGTLNLVYISRINHEKNLLSAIEMLQQISIEADIRFDIYGPVEDLPYWKKCKNEIKKLPKIISCNYCGELIQADVIETFQKYHVLLLPSLTENFGQIIPEALIASTPVIISNRTPWSMISPSNAGWVFPLNDKTKFTRQIEACVEMNQQSYNHISRNAYQFALDIFNNEKALNNLRNVFLPKPLAYSGGEKPKVLVMIDWYLPGFKAGGPIQSVANMVSQLKDNIDFRIITTDTDLFSDQPYANIKSDSWNTLDDGTEVYYLSGKNLNYKSIKNLISQLSFDAVYLNSFFSKYFTLYPLLILNREISTAKLIVAPRGMMGKGSLQLKAFKKKIFITLSKITGLYKNVHWHASSEIEKSEIENVFGRSVEITIARNLSPKMEVSHHEIKKLTGECRFVFLSRIARVKNLVYAIEMLGKLPAGVDVIYDIYGPMEEKEYWQTCTQKIERLPQNIKVVYRGEVMHQNIQQTLKHYHFMLMPTDNENYGHSIVESFTSGLPVIISDKTPWRNLESKKAGWDLAIDNKKRFVEVLTNCINMNQDEYLNWSKGTIKFAETILHDEEAVVQNRNLFTS